MLEMISRLVRKHCRSQTNRWNSIHLRDGPNIGPSRFLGFLWNDAFGQMLTSTPRNSLSCPAALDRQARSRGQRPRASRPSAAWSSASHRS